jgi:hypothetical protein
LKAKFGVDTDKYGLSYMIAFGYRKADPANPKQEEISKILVVILQNIKKSN